MKTSKTGTSRFQKLELPVLTLLRWAEHESWRAAHCRRRRRSSCRVRPAARPYPPQPSPGLILRDLLLLPQTLALHCRRLELRCRPRFAFSGEPWLDSSGRELLPILIRFPSLLDLLPLRAGSPPRRSARSRRSPSVPSPVRSTASSSSPCAPP